MNKLEHIANSRKYCRRYRYRPKRYME